MPKKIIIQLIDSFYPLFKKLMPLQTFRYAACGGANTILGITVFYVFHQYVFKEKIFDFGFYAMKAHTASNIISFIVTLIVGFLLMKYVVFVESNLKGRIQLFRYTLSSVTNLIISTLLLKGFIELLHFNALVAVILAAAIVICISYLSQKHFSFKIKQ